MKHTSLTMLIVVLPLVRTGNIGMARAADSNAGPELIVDVEAFIKERTEWDKRYAELIRDFNPPAVFIREGHRQGMKVIAWISLPGQHGSTKATCGCDRAYRRSSNYLWEENPP